MGKVKKHTRNSDTILSKLFRHVKEDKLQNLFLIEDHNSSFLLNYFIDLDKIKSAPQVNKMLKYLPRLFRDIVKPFTKELKRMMVNKSIVHEHSIFMRHPL